MNNRGSWWETFTWAGTVVGGAWLSMQVARAMADLVGGAAAAEHEPVQEVVQEVLAAHRIDDTAMVHAFEEALEAEEAEDRVSA